MARGAHEDARCAYEDALDRFGEAAAPTTPRWRAWGSPARWRRSDGASAAAAEPQPRATSSPRSVPRARPRRAEAPLADQRSGRAGRAHPRELDVLRLVARGLNNGEIAERLVLSPHTVHRHMANARTKLQLPSRAAVVAYAARVGLL